MTKSDSLKESGSLRSRHTFLGHSIRADRIYTRFRRIAEIGPDDGHHSASLMLFMKLIVANLMNSDLPDILIASA